MRIGTPLSRSALRVMLLGAGELGKELAIEFQRLGVEVIAVDRYPNAPAHQVAHRAHVIDMTDEEALRDLILRERPALVVPELEALATDALLAIEADGLAQVIPNARAAQLTMNREGIRRLAADTLGLPTSRFAFADSLEELRAACDVVGLPCMIKPVMSSSGKGQCRVDSLSELDEAWRHAQSGARVKQGRVIVESVIDFDYEITLLTVRSVGENGKEETHFCAPIGHRQERGDYVESWQPQPMPRKTLERAQEIARTVTDALGGRGIFGVELFVRADQVWFSEVSPRPHDTGLVTMATQALSEFALHVRAILGLPVSTELLTPGASAVIYGCMQGRGIIYEGIDDALRVPGTDLRLFGKPQAYPRRRMGVALARADEIGLARERARECAARVRPVTAD